MEGIVLRGRAEIIEEFGCVVPTGDAGRFQVVNR